jgi:hypothetical protein
LESIEIKSKLMDEAIIELEDITFADPDSK